MTADDVEAQFRERALALFFDMKAALATEQHLALLRGDKGQARDLNALWRKVTAPPTAVEAAARVYREAERVLVETARLYGLHEPPPRVHAGLVRFVAELMHDRGEAHSIEAAEKAIRRSIPPRGRANPPRLTAAERAAIARVAAAWDAFLAVLASRNDK